MLHANLHRGSLRAVAGLASALLLCASPAGHASTTPPSGLPYKGLLQLKGGNATTVVYTSESGATTTQTLTTIRRNDCRLSQPSTTRLLDFSATQGGIAAPVGLVTGAMGVYSGSQGTPCSRFDSAFGQALTVDLGASLKTAVPNVAFYRLELDIEAKSNLSLELQVLIDGVPTTSYFLRTGSSIVPGEGSDVPGSRIFNCSAASDSGPDSGARDNCRWVVDELGEGFRLVPRAGYGSLEGGSDPGVDGFTLVYLIEGQVGALGCGPGSSVPLSQNTSTIGDGVNEARCTVTRVDPSGVGGQCTQPIAYVFRTLGGVSDAEGCEILKRPPEQLAASIRITFPPEPWTPLGDEPPTRIQFSDGNGGLVEFAPQRCVGTVALDPNGTRTIAEVLTGELGAIDVVPDNGVIDWACILDNEQVYLGPTGPDGMMQMRVQQTILFWGDIRFERS